jgi:hypothetical protein
MHTESLDYSIDDCAFKPRRTRRNHRLDRTETCKECLFCLTNTLSCDSVETPWAASRLLARDKAGLTQWNMNLGTTSGIYIQEKNVLKELHRLESSIYEGHLFETGGSLSTFDGAMFETGHVLILGMRVKSRRLNRRGFFLGAKNDAFCTPA